MRCSMMRIVTPRSLTRRMSVSAPSISLELRPALTSSSIRIFGFIARLLASSTRLRPASVSAEAARSANAVRPVKSSCSRAASIASLTLACARGHVFQHTHARERLDDLERAGQPAARGLKRTLPGHVGAKEADAPGGSRLNPGDHVDEGRLASPVWADERDNFALPEVHAHAADGPDAAEMLADILKLEDRGAHGVAPGWVERRTVRDKRSL